MFTELDFLPANLKIQVIQKFNSYSYIRYRRVNSTANEFCSKYQSFIRIRLRNNARLYLLDSYADLIAFGSLHDKGVEVKGIQALVDYATRREGATLTLPMTFENANVLQQSIQGFYFDEVVVWNCKHYETPHENQVFHQSLSCFLLAIQHLRCPWVTVRNVNRRYLEELTRRLQPKSLTLSKIALTEEDQRLVEKMTHEIYLDFAERPPETMDLVKMCKGKKIVSLQNQETRFPDVFWNVFENLMKCWKKLSIPLQVGLLVFGENGSFTDEDLSLPTSRFSRLGAAHLGSYYSTNISDLIRRQPILKYDYFFMKCQEEEWAVFYLRRSRTRGGITTVRLGFTNTSRRGHRPEEYLAKIISHLFCKAVLDYSTLREQLEQQATIEGKKKELQEFISRIVSFYTPPLVAVLQGVE